VLEHALDLLDRFKWWVSGVLAFGMVIWADPPDKGSWSARGLFGLFVVLLWIPAAIRTARGFTRAREAFKDGLEGR
jgi:hypothetical protein